MQDEEWRPIPGFDGYEVSSLGRVMSYRRQQPYEMKGWPVRGGYLSVTIGGRYLGKHILVALAFLGPRPDGLQVRHLDGNASNNRVDNLRYGTSSENNFDRVRHGTHPWAAKTHCPKGHPYDEANTYVLPSRPRQRYCRTCKRDHGRRRAPVASA